MQASMIGQWHVGVVHLISEQDPMCVQRVAVREKYQKVSVNTDTTLA